MTLWAYNFTVKVDAFFLRCGICRKDITGLETTQVKANEAADAAGAVVLEIGSVTNSSLSPAHRVLACRDCKSRNLIEFAQKDEGE